MERYSPKLQLVTLVARISSQQKEARSDCRLPWFFGYSGTYQNMNDEFE
jgi:hypothetical protein